MLNPPLYIAQYGVWGGSLDFNLDGSVLALLRFPSIFSHQNSRKGILLTIAIMKEKQEHNQFEKECDFLSHFSSNASQTVIDD